MFSDGQENFISSLVELLEARNHVTRAGVGYHSSLSRPCPQASGVKDFTYGNNKELQDSLNKVEKADDPFFNRRKTNIIRDQRTCIREMMRLKHQRTFRRFASESLAKIARLVRIMTTRCMEEALYFCTGQEQRKETGSTLV